VVEAAGEELWSTLSRIVEYRRQCTGLTETGLWALGLMQDDFGYVAITAAVGGVIRDTIPTVLAEYGICISMSKCAEDEAAIGGVQPNERMLYIGADVYMHNCEYPRFRGQDKSLARFEELMKEWSAYAPGRLVPLLLLQRLIGMCLFHGHFSGECCGISTVAFGASENGVVTTGWCHVRGSVMSVGYSSKRWHGAISYGAAIDVVASGPVWMQLGCVPTTGCGGKLSWT
jgi:hypothetical protein